MKNGIKHISANTANNKFERICSYGVAILSLLFFGYIAVWSIVQTSVIDPENFVGEKILYEVDNVILNIIIIVLFLGLMFLLFIYKGILNKINEKVLIIGLAIYTIVLGLVWVLNVQSIPAADSGTIYNTACSIIKGDWTPFITSNSDFYDNVSYYHLYKFQLGMVFISEIVYRIFGYGTAIPMQVFNVFALAAMHVGLLLIAKRIFRSKAVVVIMTFILAACLQPIFFTAFAYGNIIGFSAAVWSYYFIIRFMQSENKKRVLFFIPASLFMAFSILAKYNNLIWMLAIAIGLVIYIIKSKKWVHILSIICFCLVSVNVLNLVIASYEYRSGVELKDGVSQILYLDMGLNESGIAPGWYNGMAKSKYLQYNCDVEAAESDAKADISTRVKLFLSDPGYAKDFWSKKILSQWNEPSYESVWVSQVKRHYNGEIREGTWLYSVYNGKGKVILNSYFDIYQMIVFILFCIAMVGIIINGCGAEVTILLTTLIGGFIYHLLFEAKSQYSLTYFILIAFFASYGVYVLLKSVQFKVKK